MARLILSLFRNQPRPFYMIFMLEIWERFGYYTVQGILVLYFIRFLGASDEDAYHLFGAFSALVYGLVAVGGYLGDKVLGTKRTMLLGLVVLALGYLALALADTPYVYWALGLVCVGNGLFKANPSSLLSKCYESTDPRIYGAYTLYYMAINLGSIFALIGGPTLASRWGYSYAFSLSFIGLLLGLANYVFQRSCLKEIDSPLDNHLLRWWQWLFIILAIVAADGVAAYLLQEVMIAKSMVCGLLLLVLLIYFSYMLREPLASMKRMLLAFILMLEAVIFFTLYQQMPTSLNLFAVHQVNAHLFGIAIDPQSFQVLNPLWIVSMSPVLAIIYEKLYQRGYAFPVPYKFALGMTSCGLSFLLLYFSRFIYQDAGMVSSWWLVASYFFQSIGELLVSALGVAMVAELVPHHISGFVMGMWFLTSATAGFFGATVASYTALPRGLKPGLESLTIYTHVFAYIGLTTLFIALLMWIVAPYLTRLMGKTLPLHKID